MKWPYPIRVHRAKGEPRAQTAAFRLYGPTCDAIDAVAAPIELPADLSEGDVIEFAMLGAYGVAMATRFNGFGEVETETVSDFPWASVYDRPVADQPAAIEDETGRVVSFSRLNRRRRNRIMKRR